MKSWTEIAGGNTFRKIGASPTPATPTLATYEAMLNHLYPNIGKVYNLVAKGIGFLALGKSAETAPRAVLGEVINNLVDLSLLK